jgi:hypothetical protein
MGCEACLDRIIIVSSCISYRNRDMRLVSVGICGLITENRRMNLLYLEFE